MFFLVFHPYLKQAGYTRYGLQVGLWYDIQCHDVDEYLIYRTEPYFPLPTIFEMSSIMPLPLII